MLNDNIKQRADCSALWKIDLDSEAISSNELNYVEVFDINWLYGQILKFKDLSFINFDDGDFSVTLDVGTFLSCLMCNNVKKKWNYKYIFLFGRY